MSFLTPPVKHVFFFGDGMNQLPVFDMWLQIGGHARHLFVATALHSAAGRRSDLTRHSGAGTLGHQPGSLNGTS